MGKIPGISSPYGLEINLILMCGSVAAILQKLVLGS